MTTRRAFVAGLVAAPALLRAGTASAQKSKGDVGIVESLVDLEQLAAFAYSKLSLVPDFGAHEQEHADRLIVLGKEMVAALPPPPTDLAAVDKVVPGFAAATTRDERLVFAITLELYLVGAYTDAIERLTEGRLLQLAATVVGSHGQHLAALRTAAGRDPVPDPFERGS